MENVGVGASSCIFKFKNNQTTVIKSLFPGYEAEIDFELQVYELLGNHPRIAKCFGKRGKSIELLYYRRGCIDKERLSQPSVPYSRWIEQITEGVVYVHSKGVIHCDLRTPNILITDSGDVLLADFASSQMSVDRVSGISNKIRYCLPTFDEPGHIITAQDDIFALGTVMYNLVTGGKDPFEQESDDEVVKFYSSGKFPDVSGLPMGFQIETCWRGGYSNAIEILNDIRMFELQLVVYVMVMHLGLTFLGNLQLKSSDCCV